jgi:hypothetical protein
MKCVSVEEIKKSVQGFNHRVQKIENSKGRYIKNKSVGHFTSREGDRRRSLATRPRKILLIFFLDCNVERPVVKSSKFLRNLTKNNFFAFV